MSKRIDEIRLSETLTLVECRDGFWLYDEARGMNLSMRAKTPQDAFVDCISYYQEHLARLEEAHSELVAKVNSFVSQIAEDEDSHWY